MGFIKHMLFFVLSCLCPPANLSRAPQVGNHCSTVRRNRIIVTPIIMSNSSHHFMGRQLQHLDLCNISVPTVWFYIAVVLDCFVSGVCPGESVQFFKKTKLRILIIMFLTRKLAGSVKYKVLGVLFYKCERKKNNVPKGGRFCRVYELKD